MLSNAQCCYFLLDIYLQAKMIDDNSRLLVFFNSLSFASIFF